METSCNRDLFDTAGRRDERRSDPQRRPRSYDEFALFKGFRIREKISFQLRAEAQDALNHPQFSPPNTVPTSTLFGQTTTTVIAQQRVVTVGARLIW